MNSDALFEKNIEKIAISKGLTKKIAVGLARATRQVLRKNSGLQKQQRALYKMHSKALCFQNMERSIKRDEDF